MGFLKRIFKIYSPSKVFLNFDYNEPDDQAQFEADQREVFGVPLLARYRYYHNDIVVRLVSAGKNWETEEPTLAYQEEATGVIYYIPLFIFNGKVSVNGKMIDRFTRIINE